MELQNKRDRPVRKNCGAFFEVGGGPVAVYGRTVSTPFMPPA
jgi:hypothetical protein